MLKKVLLTIVLFLVLSSGMASGEIAPKMLVRVYLQSEQDNLQLLLMHPDIAYISRDFADIITDAEELNRITMLGLKTDVVHEDFPAFLQSRLDPTKDMGGYKTLDEINIYIDGIIADHPGIVSAKVDIGHSFHDRPIYAIKISDNPEIDEDEPEVLYTAAIHAREVITPEVLFHFMDHLTDNYGTDPRVTSIVNNRELWFIPLINVDGYYRNEVVAPYGGGMWRKNTRYNADGSLGVDLNRNFGYYWGLDDVGSSPDGAEETYRGTGPFSEPELQNVRDFTIAHEFVISLYYHAYSDVYLFPWGYNRQPTIDNDIYVALSDSMGVYNGYSNDQNFYPVNGGACDWNYGEQTTKNMNYSFVVEVGSLYDYFWPPLYRIPDLVAENLEPNMLMAEIADNVRAIFPPSAPEITLDPIVLNEEYQVLWLLNDDDNPADYYELREGTSYGLAINTGESMSGLYNNGFNVTGDRFYSESSSFYSGSGNDIIRYIQTTHKYEVNLNDSAVFMAWYDLEEDYDFFYLEISTDGSNFTPIKGNISSQVNTYGYNRNVVGVTGASDDWVRAAFDLSDYNGQSVYFRLSYYTSPGELSEGVYIDDFYPMIGFENEVIYSHVEEGFYTFYDKPGGTYYYIVRAIDHQGQAGSYSDVSMTRVIPPFLCGDTDGNDVYDLLDIVFMIDHKFKDGPAPYPPEAADTNSDGAVDLLDIVVMIDNKFKDGPAPDCLEI
jgi:hypothetical protein